MVGRVGEAYQVPTITVLDPTVGEPIETNLNDLKLRRPQEVAFRIAKRILDTYFRAADNAEQPWLFPLRQEPGSQLPDPIQPSRVRPPTASRTAGRSWKCLICGTLPTLSAPTWPRSRGCVRRSPDQPRTVYLVRLAPHKSWSRQEGEGSGQTAPRGPARVIGRSASPRLSVAPDPWRSHAASPPAAGPRPNDQLSLQASWTRKRCRSQAPAPGGGRAAQGEEILKVDGL